MKIIYVKSYTLSIPKLDARMAPTKSRANRLKSHILASRTLRLVPIIVLLGILPACIIPYPHTTSRTPEIKGRVLDSATREPVQGAKVFFIRALHHTTRTDARGYFFLQATRNFHWAYVSGEDWPEDKGVSMEISHTNYISYQFSPNTLTDEENMGDILLKRQP
jgi:hypothetical protein